MTFQDSEDKKCHFLYLKSVITGKWIDKLMGKNKCGAEPETYLVFNNFNLFTSDRTEIDRQKRISKELLENSRIQIGLNRDYDTYKGDYKWVRIEGSF